MINDIKMNTVVVVNEQLVLQYVLWLFNDDPHQHRNHNHKYTLALHTRCTKRDCSWVLN